MCPRGASGVGTAVVYKGACCGVQCDRTGVDFMPSQAAVERPCHATTVRAAYKYHIEAYHVMLQNYKCRSFTS